MFTVHRSFSSVLKDFDKFAERPPGEEREFKKRKKDLIEIAKMIQETMETPGWKRVIGPLLESKGNPKQLFNPEVRQDPYKYCMVEACNQILTFLGNFMSLLNEKEEEATENPD